MEIFIYNNNITQCTVFFPQSPKDIIVIFKKKMKKMLHNIPFLHFYFNKKENMYKNRVCENTASIGIKEYYYFQKYCILLSHEPHTSFCLNGFLYYTIPTMFIFFLYITVTFEFLE